MSEAFENGWRIAKGIYEDIPEEERRKYFRGSMESLPGHKKGCELRLNGYYPDYSHKQYDGECTCDSLCVGCDTHPIWIKDHTDLCWNCSMKASQQGLIEPHPIMQYYLETQWMRDNT